MAEVGDDLMGSDGEELWRRTTNIIENSASSSQGNNIVVVTRVRPFNKREKMHAEDEANNQVWIMDPGAKSAHAEPSTFRFDYCFDSFDPTAANFVSQQMVFEKVGLDILAKAWGGYHACLFAYGQTGSGKTYSIMGYGHDKGVIPRICETLFYFIRRAGQDRFRVDASYLEVYNEQIADLLCPPLDEEDFVPLKPKERIKIETKLKKLLKEGGQELECSKLRALLDPEEARKQRDDTKPKVREDPERGVVVDGLKHFAVSSFADCEKLLEEGLANRTVGSTAMNASSSRSHCVFTLELQHLEGSQARSKITLIDLAGSEKTQTAKTEGQLLVEGININKSLSCLGQCIAGLAKAAAKKDLEESKKTDEQKREEAATKLAERRAADEAKEKTLKKATKKTGSKYGVKTGAPPKRIEQSEEFVPFRESILTWILRDSLIGNSKTVMLAALSPSSVNYHETMSTLRFAQQAKQLKTKAIVNEDPIQRLVAELKAEIEVLRQQKIEDERTMRKSVVFKTESTIVDKEAEVARLVEKELAAKEKTWKEREANMQALLEQRTRETERVVTSLTLGDASDSDPYLTMLSRDPAISRSVRIAVDKTGENFLRIGRAGSSVVQNLEVDGVGIAKETCIIWGGVTKKEDGLFKIKAGSPNSIVYVNGKKLKYHKIETYEYEKLEAEAEGKQIKTIQEKEYELMTNKNSYGEDIGILTLKHHDRVALGHCAYLLLVIDPVIEQMKKNSFSMNVINNETTTTTTSYQLSLLKQFQHGKEITYDSCVHEVMLMRAHGENEYRERLAAFVVNKLRMPATRAAFEQELLRAVHGVREANAIASMLGCFVKFRIMGGGEVDMQRLYSLRLEDALPHHAVKLSVQAVMMSEVALMKERRKDLKLKSLFAYGIEGRSSRRRRSTAGGRGGGRGGGRSGRRNSAGRGGRGGDRGSGGGNEVVENLSPLLVTADGETVEPNPQPIEQGVVIEQQESVEKPPVVNPGVVVGDDDDDEPFADGTSGTIASGLTQEGFVGIKDIEVEEDVEHKSGGHGQVLLEVGVDDFGDILQGLKFTFMKVKKVARSLAAAAPHHGPNRIGALIRTHGAARGHNDLDDEEEDEGQDGRNKKEDKDGQLVNQTFESCAIEDENGKPYLDYRSGFEKTLHVLGIMEDGMGSDWDITFTLDTLLAGDDTQVTLPLFRDALWVFLRKRFLSALRGPWMLHEPDDATARLFCVGRTLPESHRLKILSGASAALARTLEELHLQLEKAVKRREWDVAVQLEESIGIVREQQATSNSILSHQKSMKEAHWRRKTNYNLNIKTSEQIEETKSFKPRASRIIAWRGGMKSHQEMIVPPAVPSMVLPNEKINENDDDNKNDDDNDSKSENKNSSKKLNHHRGGGFLSFLHRSSNKTSGEGRGEKEKRRMSSSPRKLQDGDSSSVSSSTPTPGIRRNPSSKCHKKKKKNRKESSPSSSSSSTSSPRKETSRLRERLEATQKNKTNQSERNELNLEKEKEEEEDISTIDQRNSIFRKTEELFVSTLSMEDGVMDDDNLLGEDGDNELLSGDFNGIQEHQPKPLQIEEVGTPNKIRKKIPKPIKRRSTGSITSETEDHVKSTGEELS